MRSLYSEGVNPLLSAVKNIKNVVGNQKGELQ
jgi:hypothetical protein